MCSRTPLHVSLVLRHGRRLARWTPAAKRPDVFTGAQVRAYMLPYFSGLHIEKCWVIPIDHHGRAVYPAPVEVSVGTRDEVIVCAASVLTVALLSGTATFIIVHNHPSGDPEPSIGDSTSTRRMVKAVKAIEGILLWDDVIVAEEGYYSFRASTRIIPRLRPRS
jgi:DNA repair protein RadC